MLALAMGVSDFAEQKRDVVPSARKTAKADRESGCANERARERLQFTTCVA
jgi:hypothetical protein